jgi:hypothetical protein
MAILSNENLIREFYEEWCLLLDKEFSSTLPMLISGLQSILFAINIDNPNFNMSPKISASKSSLQDQNSAQITTESSEPIKIKNKPSIPSTSFGGNSLENSELTSIKIKKANKIRKNNVVVFDIEDDVEEEMNNQGNELNHLSEENSVVQNSVDSSHLNDVQDKVGVLTNPIKYSKNSPYSRKNLIYKMSELNATKNKHVLTK